LENQLLKPYFALQSEDDATDRTTSQLFTYVQQYMSRYLSSMSSSESEWWTTQTENVVTVFHWYAKCTDVGDYIQLSLTAYKLFTGRSYTTFIRRRFELIFGNLQSDATSELLHTLRKAFDTVESISENPLLQKLTGLYSYLLVQGFLSRFGLELNDEDYSRLEQKALYAQYSSKKGLWMNILDTSLFMCERFHEWKRTGEISSFLHSGGEYEAWAKKADKLLALAPFTANLAAHGTTYFTFVSDLNDAVEQGEAYARFTKKVSGYEVAVIKRKLMSLQLLKNTEITRRSAQKERRAPFGVLVHGTSSVAKSSFTKMLYYYYGSLFGLDTEDHYRYVRSPTDEYWSNFDSSKWCIQLDDIAFLMPSATSDVDPTLKEMLNVVNNVPFVPPQAALEDKGKTPVMARLVVATTNAKDLNAIDYFWCPLAVRRRLPYVVNVAPKPEYLAANQRFIDPSKLTSIDGAFPDYWVITVQKVVPVFDGVRDQATLEDVAVYTSTAEFLKNFGETAMAHELTQDKAMTCDDAMRTLRVCAKCYLVASQCACVELQNEDYAEFEPVAWVTTVVQAPSSVWQMIVACVSAFFGKCFDWFIEVRLWLYLMDWLMHFAVWRRILYGYVLPRVSDSLQVKLVGRLNGSLTGDNRWKIALGVLATVVGGATLYMTMRKPKSEPMQQQGNVMGTTEKDLPKEERSNVWYNPTIELTKFDVPKASQSLARASDTEVRDMFARNCVRLLIETTVDGHTSTLQCGCVCAGSLAGHQQSRFPL
jgi:hypothetical protein